MRFPWKLYKTLVSGQAQHVLAKSNLWASKLSKSSHWPHILSKMGKQCAFHETCTKRAFHAICSTGLNFTPIGENSRLSIKIVQNVLFTPCGGRFGQIAFFDVLGKKSCFTGLKFTPIRENSRLSMKIVQNVLFTPCGGRFGQIAFSNVLGPNIALPEWTSRQYGKQ